MSLSSNIIDIRKENLTCHHIMFIKDVVTSSFDSLQQTFKTRSTRLTYRHARLNGIIIRQKQARFRSHNDVFETHLWIDDGTSVIRAILSPGIMQRKDADLITVSGSITVFGKLEQRFNKKLQRQEIMMRCGGFKIETDSTGELYHWLKALQDRPKAIEEDDDTLATTVEKKLKGNLKEKQRVENSSNESDKENRLPEHHLPHNMFYSLSSEPSPNRLYNPDVFMQEEQIMDINDRNASYLWSPDHAYATSTPLRLAAEMASPHTRFPAPSPLRHTLPLERAAEEDEMFFEEFADLDGLDLDALEADAIKQREAELAALSSATAAVSESGSNTNKRKWDPSMEE